MHTRVCLTLYMGENVYYMWASPNVRRCNFYISAATHKSQPRPPTSITPSIRSLSSWASSEVLQKAQPIVSSAHANEVILRLFVAVVMMSLEWRMENGEWRRRTGATGYVAVAVASASAWQLIKA